MQNVQEKMIQFIKKNRVSTTEVADCLGKSGAIQNVHAINRGHFCVGPVRYIYGYSESNWPIHEQARDVQPGEVVIMDGIQVNGRALVGELVSKFILLYRDATAIVMLGRARDANDLIKQNYPVWCEGFTPVGCFNRDVPMTAEIEEEVKRKADFYHGSIAVCDDTGVVIIPQEQVNEDFLKKLQAIEEQEDIWFDCIDRKKWDTYQTVCLKSYLADSNKSRETLV